MTRTLLLLLCTASMLPSAVVYRVRLSAAEGGVIVSMPAEQYVSAVVAGEAGNMREDEALKAMAVAARTYAAHFHSRHAAEGYDFCSTSHCQRAILREVNEKSREATAATRGQLLWFHSEPALAVYTEDCGGKTESAEAVWPDERAAYLQSLPDPFCPRTAWHWSASLPELERALRTAGLESPKPLQRVVVLRRTSSGRASILSLMGPRGAAQLISASSFRFAIGRTLGWNTLRSEQYEVESNGASIRFEGLGEGHGVGLCQHGAEEMAAGGKSYKDILKFYYRGTQVSVLAHDVAWVTARGVHAQVFADRLSNAVAASKIADEEATDLSRRFGFTLPSEVSLYLYPDLQSFRNGTGEPGWIAAHTVGTRVETQPLQVLESHGGLKPILRHELLHVMVESAARPGLPFWFREGLVGYLSGGAATTIAPRDSEAHLIQREDMQQAREAYAAANRRIQELERRYGRAELLRWVRNGLPEDVAHSSTSSKPVNSR